MLRSLKELLNCVGLILIIVGHIVKNVRVGLEIRKEAITVKKNNAMLRVSLLLGDKELSPEHTS